MTTLLEDLGGLLQNGLLELHDHLLEVGALLADEEPEIPWLKLQVQFLYGAVFDNTFFLPTVVKV